RIVDAQVKTLTDKALGERHERALAQVVSAGLERETDHTDVALALSEHVIHRLIDMHAIARKQAREHRRYYVALLAKIKQRPKILGQAGAAEGEARAQVRG